MYSVTSGWPGNTKQRPIFQNESESDQDSLLTLRNTGSTKNRGLLELLSEGKIVEIQL